MIRVPEDKKILICSHYQMFEESGLLVHEDEAWTGVIEEQFNRIKESYDSGKFKQMNDDESLSDLCELFAKEVRKAKWQKFVFEYPTDILRRLTFEDEIKGQWDAEAFEEMADAILKDTFDEELDKEIDEMVDDLFDNWDEYETLDKAIDGLNLWMMEKGFEYGERNFGLKDVNGCTVASLDLAWPFGVYGIQRGFTKPVAVNIIKTVPELVKKAEDFGFTCFISIEEFKAFIEKNYK